MQLEIPPPHHDAITTPHPQNPGDAVPEVTPHHQDNLQTISPATWPERKQSLTRNANDLYNLLGEYGSSHASATWRKDPAFNRGLGQEVSVAFDPQVDDWDESYKDHEAEVMANASVVLFRLENKDLQNAGSASIAEIGIAAVSAVAKGQKLIVSFEEDFVKSLYEDPALQAQFASLEVMIDNLSKLYPNNIVFHRGDDLEGLGKMAADALKNQRENPLAPFDFKDYQTAEQLMLEKEHYHVVMTGSSKAHTPSLEGEFEAERASIRDNFESIDDLSYRDLTTGAIAQAWDTVYQLTGEAGARAKQALFTVEMDEKMKASMLVVPVHGKALTKAGSAEIGWFLLNSLRTGQKVAVMMEHFDADAYLTGQIKALNLPTNDSVAFRQALIDQNLLTQSQVDQLGPDELGTIQAAFANDTVNVKSLRKTVFASTQLWRDADNTARTRTLVEAHLKLLHQTFPGLFILTHSVPELNQEVQTHLQRREQVKVEATNGSSIQQSIENTLTGQPAGGRDDEAANLAQSLLEQQRNHPEIIGNSSQIKAFLASSLNISPDNIITEASLYDTGPNTMPSYRAELKISLQAQPNQKQKEIITLRSTDSVFPDDRGFSLDNVPFYLDLGSFVSELDRIVHPEKYPKATHGNTGSLWWKD